MSGKWRQRYYATGLDTATIETFDEGYFMEHNPSVDMYRINHPLGVPTHLMGYSPHRTALTAQLSRFLKRRNKRERK